MKNLCGIAKNVIIWNWRNLVPFCYIFNKVKYKAIIRETFDGCKYRLYISSARL